MRKFLIAVLFVCLLIALYQAWNSDYSGSGLSNRAPSPIEQSE